MDVRTPKRARSNSDLYASTEFAKWSTARGLSAVEHLLIDRYLARDGDTLEAGTGGGRILYAMREMGFTSLAGFDNVPEMVRAARSGDSTGDIRFDVQEATDLDYDSGSFDQVVYLQQIICFIDSEDGRAAALREAHRVLRTPGIALFSFLSWDARRSRGLIRAMGIWLRVLRSLQRTDRSAGDWPWLRHGDRPNIGAILDRGPHVHWYTGSEARRVLEATGFTIVFPGGQAPDEGIAGGQEATQKALGGDGDPLFYVCLKN